MTNRLAVLCCILIGLTRATAQTNNNSFPLWPDGAPGALGQEPTDIPTLTVYLSQRTNTLRPALLICPGGSYVQLAKHEGEDYARFLNELGIAGFVLKYRLGTNGYRHPAMLLDAARALRIVRARAGEWNIDPKRIGIIGSSAGGHVASMLMTRFDAGKPGAADPIERVSSRPDLGILCYPVITMGEHAHRTSKLNLLGANPSPELVMETSSQLHVTRDTPPCFIWHTSDDTTVPVENSLEFAAALRGAGVPFELHIYQHGKHGQGLGSRDYELIPL